MKISAIAAIGKNREIGFENKLLWKIPNDLKNFKELTMGHTLIMGRKTYESIGRGLNGRSFIILTSDPYYSVSGHQAAHGVDEAIYLAKQKNTKELFICGGAKVYKDFLPLVETLYLSKVNFEGGADTYFPEFEHYDWKLIEEKFYPSEGVNTPSWSFNVFSKRV